MLRSLARRGVRALLAVALVGILGVAALLLLLSAGPIRLAFLDGTIAQEVSAMAPEVRATVARTELVRAGNGVALRVADLRLARRDGTPLASLPAVTVRPSLRALLRGRLVIAQLAVSDAAIALTRTADDTWHVGGEDGGVKAAVADLFTMPAPAARGGRALPEILLTRARVTVDDQRAGLQIAVADADLTLSPRPDGWLAALTASLDLESSGEPVRGTLRLPVEIAATVARGPDGALGHVGFSVRGAAGELALAGAGAPDALDRLEAVGTYLPDVATILLERMTARLGASTVDGTMTVILSDLPFVALDAAVDTLALADLSRLWPPDAAATVRTWLAKHAHVGVLRRCRVQLGLHGAADERSDGAALPAASPPPSPARNTYDVTCNFDGVTAHYLPPMAPIRAASGSARLTADRLTVDVAGGTVGACRVDGGTLSMDLTVDPPRAAIAADVAGATADVLALVDAPPLRLVTPLGITPKDLGGQSRVHAELTLPIKRRLAAREVGLQAKATLTGASLPPLVAGIGIANGTLTAQTDGRSFAVQGTTDVTGLPEVAGPVRMTLKVAPRARSGEQAVTLSLAGDGVAAEGTLTLAGKALAAVDVERLRLGGHDLAGTVRRQGAGYKATLTGASLDLAALLANPGLRGTGSALAAPTDVAVRLARVRVASDVELADVHGTVRAADGVLDGGSLSGTVVPGGRFRATMERRSDAEAGGAPPGIRRLAVSSEDGGRLLNALGIETEIEGGTLTLDATTDQRGAAAYLAGELRVHDARVVRAPILARILSLGSFESVAALVQRKQGLHFSEAKVPFHWEAPTLTVTDVRAVGAIGLTGDGFVTFARDGPSGPVSGTCDVHGNVVPAYTLVGLLGRIPLIDKVPVIGSMVGGKVRGPFGIGYEVKGTLPDPGVRVNPVSGLTPSTLRTWFVDPFTRGAADAGGARR